jgi:pimeloyl-ACP methyl ester carboxylesterase
MMREVWVTDGAVRSFAVEGGEGPALVFLHGGLTSHQSVLPIVAPLVDRYRVVAPDLRGSGRSRYSELPTFEQMSDDLVRLLDHLGVAETFVGGISSGSGPAVHFALHHPDRTRGLIVVTPVYAGSETGYTSDQAAAFAGMDSVAGRAIDEGIDVLRPMFFSQLPSGTAERAWKIASEFDPASVVATSRFIASGAQPFESVRELRSIRAPTLLVRGDDTTHPSHVSDLYAGAIADCTVVPATEPDTAGAIRDFCDAVIGGAA